MSDAIITTEALTRRYGARRGIDDVSIRVPAGAMFGFLGPNGAGKTTTIRVLLGFLRPTSGAARVFGLDCWQHSAAIKSEIGYVPGDLRLYPWLNGHEALSLFGAVRRRDLAAEGKRLAQSLELDLSVKVRKMSRGMRQKLGLILALAPRPRLLVLDEPTSGLDPLMQDRLQDELRAFASRGGTVFFSSHVLSEVENLCERVAIVRAGRIVANDTLESLRRQAGHEVAISFKAAASNLNPPHGLTLEDRSPTRWKGRLHGDLAPLLSFLAAHEVDDVSITRPDLETLFRRFYEPSESIAGAAAPTPLGATQ